MSNIRVNPFPPSVPKRDRLAKISVQEGIIKKNFL